MPDDPALLALIRFGLLCIAASTFAFLLHRSALPGGRPAALLVGGCLAGILAGPDVLGRLKPDLYQHIFVGAQVERADIERLQSAHDAEIQALRSIDVSPAAIDERTAEQQAELAPQIASLHRARDRFSRPARIGEVALVAIAVFAGFAAARPRCRFTPAAPGAAAAGVLSIFFGGLLLALFSLWMLPIDRPRALAIGLGTAGGSVLAGLPLRWVGARGRGPDARIASIAGAFAAAVAIVTFARETASWLAPIFAAAALGALLSSITSRSKRFRSFARTILMLAVATSTANLAATTSVQAASHSWLFVALVVLLGGCGQFLGTVLGCATFGDATQRTQGAALWLETWAVGAPITQVLALGALSAAAVLNPLEAAGAAISVAVLASSILSEMSVSTIRSLLARTQAYPDQ